MHNFKTLYVVNVRNILSCSPCEVVSNMKINQNCFNVFTFCVERFLLSFVKNLHKSNKSINNCNGRLSRQTDRPVITYLDDLLCELAETLDVSSRTKCFSCCRKT